MNKPPPLKGRNMRIPIIIPMRGRPTVGEECRISVQAFTQAAQALF